MNYKVISIFLALCLCSIYGKPARASKGHLRRKRETELCKVDVITTSWSSGKNGQLRVKMPDSIKIGDEVIVVVGFSGSVNSFQAWGNCLSVQNELNDEDNEADIAFTVQSWMPGQKCSGPGITMTFGYTMSTNDGASVEAIFILVNDEEVDEIDQCVGEEGGEEGENGGEEGENGGEIVTGEVECNKLFKVIADRPGQLQGYIEFVSPVDDEVFDIEVGTDKVVENLILDGIQKEDLVPDCDEADGRIHYFTKKQKVVKGETVRITFNLNYDQNTGPKPKIEGVFIFVGDEEITCGDIVECPDEEGEGGEEGEGEEEGEEEGEDGAKDEKKKKLA